MSDLFYDTPAIDLLDYGNDDGPVYYWMEEDSSDLQEYYDDRVAFFAG